MNGRIVIAGGTGFIGSALASEWRAEGREVVILTRSKRDRTDGVIEASWDGTSLGDWVQHLESADAVINLAGKNVKCLHTPENVQALMDSRVNAIRAIAQALERLKNPPGAWIQAGAVGYYGNAKTRLCDENAPNGMDPLADICRQCEYAFRTAAAPKTRKVLLRIGFVLGRDGGALPILARMTRWFLGGSAGSGKQYVSWIHIRDLVRMFQDAAARNELSGTFNAVGPNPATNRELMRALRRTLHRPWSPPAPAWAVRMGARYMKFEPSLALDGCRVIPKRFSDAGFQFQFPQLDAALRDIFPE